ncbi:MAG: response regulator transcription factor [Chloroflexota bacterium]
MDKISILIADDHTLFRKGIRKMLEAEEDVLVVGEAVTGRWALEQARALMPDIILMDIKMPGLDGVEATRTLRREMPHVGIIFCTMFEDDECVFAGLKAGGRGYTLKEADPGDHAAGHPCRGARGIAPQPHHCPECAASVRCPARRGTGRPHSLLR